VVLLNLVPDPEGRIRIPRADLKGKPQLRILAVDPLSSVLKTIALEDTPVETRELRLASGLDPAKTYSEQKTHHPLNGRRRSGKSSTRRPLVFEACDTIAKAYRLLATLGGNPTLEEFSFVANWPDLDRSQKLDQYSKHACHELSFFLYQKDPEFFRSVIAPYLKNKKDKTFMDHWLLGDDLSDYLEPWRFGRLKHRRENPLGPPSSVIKNLPSSATCATAPISSRWTSKISTVGSTPLCGFGAVETEGGVRQIIQSLREQQDETNKALLLGFGAAHPATPAPAMAAPMSSLA